VSDPFTNPINQDWSMLLDEILLAYSERRSVFGLATWNPTKQYNPDELVTHGGYSWRSLVNYDVDDYNTNREPGTDDWWVLESISNSWDSETTYSMGQETWWGGQNWICAKDGNIGNEPIAENVWWRLLNFFPEWDENERYLTNHRVEYAGLLWVSLQDDNKGNSPDNNEWWRQVSNTLNQSLQPPWYWRSLQTWLEENCLLFADHINGPLDNNRTSFLNFTLNTWRNAAGLNASGFRRSTDGIIFTYGQMQQGDKIGWWVFEDLQKGFSALQWSVQNSIYSLAQYRYANAWDASYVSALSALSDEWTNYSAWGDEGRSTILFRSAKWDKQGSGDEGGYFVSTRRMRGKPCIDIGGGFNIPRSADVYFLPLKPGDEMGEGDSSWWDPTYNTKAFQNLDLYGFSENRYWYYKNVSEFTGKTLALEEYFGNIDTPAINGFVNEETDGCTIKESYWLLKWNFTNQNA
jgi:hypothetical protein